MEQKSHHQPLNTLHTKQKQLIINRLHFFIHGTALLALFYYRITALASSRQNHLVSLHFLILVSESVLAFLWLLGQPSKWRPVVRVAYPERLPADQKLPSIDVFVCTADPDKEPCLDVMNTVISAMALDYPPGKLRVYVSDDAGSPATLAGVREAWEFSKCWVRFCRRYEVKKRCPKDYFMSERDCFMAAERRSIEEMYEEFKNSLARIVSNTKTYNTSKDDHPSLIEIISYENGKRRDLESEEDMPTLVYVAREKKPSEAHHFKAGALNVLLRVSGIMSESPFILVLDCDMYCNDPTSARQAMCFHLDPNICSNLAFVQFPQKFYDISDTDIYDGQLRYIWRKFNGLDGLRGPILAGTCFYIKREALMCNSSGFEDADLKPSSKELEIYPIHGDDFSEGTKFSSNGLQKQLKLIASSRYENGTIWGKEVGFRYMAVLEDYFTGFNLHRNGWASVYVDPPTPCFLGSSPITLAQILVQSTRWFLGLNQIAMSTSSPLISWPNRMSLAQTLGYAELAHSPLYFLPFYILGLVPQLCLLRGIPLYPKAYSPFFFVFVFVFLSAQLMNVQEILSTGHSIERWQIEQRMWIMKSLTSYLYATLDAIMEKIGLRATSFSITSKMVEKEQVERYHMGIYDFQASHRFMVPLCTLYVLNVGCLVIGSGRVLHSRKGHEMLVQIFIALFASVLHFPLLEGMVMRKDKGRVSPYVSFVSIMMAMAGSVF